MSDKYLETDYHETMRKEFEEWIKTRIPLDIKTTWYELDRLRGGRYKDNTVEEMWSAWKGCCGVEKEIR